MRPLLPSLKEKRRYIAFEVISAAPLSSYDVFPAIEESMQHYVGELGMAEAGLQFIPEAWNTQRQRGIARVNHTSADAFKASLVFIQHVKNKRVVIHSVGMSGLLTKAKKSYLAE